MRNLFNDRLNLLHAQQPYGSITEIMKQVSFCSLSINYVKITVIQNFIKSNDSRKYGLISLVKYSKSPNTFVACQPHVPVIIPINVFLINCKCLHHKTTWVDLYSIQ